MQYVASTFKANLQQPVKYVVGLLDRENSTLDLVEPLHHPAIMNFQVYRGDDKKREEEGEEEREDSLSSRRNLLKQFGSSKIRKIIRNRELTQVKDSSYLFLEDQEKVVEWARAKAAESISQGQSEEQQLGLMTAARRGMLPSHDVKASTPKKAYPLDTFVKESSWQALKRDSALIGEVLRGNLDGCSQYVQAAFASLNSAAPEDLDDSLYNTLGKADVTKALCLYEVLKWLHTSFGRSIKTEGSEVDALATKLDLPVDFVQHVVLKFFKNTDGSGRKKAFWECSKPDRMSLKIHLLLLLLMIEKYSLSSKKAAEELGIPTTEVKSLCKELGCDIKSDKVELLLKRRSGKQPEDEDSSDEDDAAPHTLESKLPQMKLKRARAR